MACGWWYGNIPNKISRPPLLLNLKSRYVRMDWITWLFKRMSQHLSCSLNYKDKDFHWESVECDRARSKAYTFLADGSAVGVWFARAARASKGILSKVGIPKTQYMRTYRLVFTDFLRQLYVYVFAYSLDAWWSSTRYITVDIGWEAHVNRYAYLEYSGFYTRMLRSSWAY